MKKKKELVSKWLVKGHKEVTAESQRISDMIDQRTKEIVASQNKSKAQKCVDVEPMFDAQEVWEQREDLLEGAWQETSGIWEV